MKIPRLKEQLELRKLNPGEIEKLAHQKGFNISRQTIYNWMTGKGNPSLEKLVELATTIGCKVNDLL